MSEHPAPPVYFSLFVLALVGCAPRPTTPSAPDVASQRPVQAELLVNSLQCGEDIREPGVYWIADTTALEERYRWLNRLNPEHQLSPPALDFATGRVLVIAMGQRPTSGYLLNFPDQPPLSDGRVLDVTVAWQEPEPDTEQAQVMVNPCLLLQLPALEVEQVRVLDQQGQVKFATGG